MRTRTFLLLGGLTLAVFLSTPAPSDAAPRGGRVGGGYRGGYGGYRGGYGGYRGFGGYGG